MQSLYALVCAGLVAGQVADKDHLVTSNLVVQSALQEARDDLLHGNYKQAVSVLESHLAQINGNPVYLRTLQDAYRKYIRELRLAKQEEEAKRYLHRLLILDRGAILDADHNIAAPAAPTVRLKSEDAPAEELLAASKSRRQADELLAKAERAYAERHFREARTLFEQANSADPHMIEAARERWAYATLFCVADQVNHAESANTSWTELEQETRQAMRLSPSLEKFGQSVLLAINKKREGSAKPELAIVHHPRNPEGWLCAETDNFRIFHNQPQELAERAANIAERTRVEMSLKWFGGVDGQWSPKCDLYLHADADQYSRSTGQFNSPGHSSIKLESLRVTQRRIDLHCDDPNMFSAVLPHETTHVVLAGEFSGQFVPRWADEGMAVLTEPKEKVSRHLTNLVRCRQEGKLFHLENLVEMENYPNDPSAIGAFYAQSVSLVEYLAVLRGPQEFTLFLREGMRYGYAKALQRHYNFATFADLEHAWERHALQGASVAQGQ